MTKLPAALAVLGCALALPAAANASYSLGIHPDGVLPGSFTSCDTGCTVVQDWSANEQQRMPGWLGAQGVVTKWVVRGEGGTARLQRVALDGAGTGRALAATDPVALTGAVQEIPAALPVRAGDAVGLVLSAGAKVSSVDLGFGESTVTWRPALGGAARAGVVTEGEAVAYQAVIEPDADGDGLGDDTQDGCVNCDTGGGTPPPVEPGPPVEPASPGPAEDADPYAAIRTAGPKASILGSASRTGSKLSVTVTNPYGFALSGRLELKRGRKVVAKAKLKLAAGAIKTVRLKVRKPGRSLTAAVTLRGPVGKARTTTAKLRITSGRRGGVDGTYRGGSGAGADWVMVISKGVVTSFTGSISLYCTKAGKQQNHTFAMIGDDPDPRVAPTGAFAWEATRGYGFDKLKFSGAVRNGTVTGNLMVESRPPVNGVSPVTGLPRIEFEYCFAGRDYTLKKR